MVKAMVMVMVMTSAVSAQGLPEAPKPKVIDRRFVEIVGALAMAKTADAITTQRNLNQGARELNPIYGDRPSPCRLAGIHAAYFAGEATGAYLLKRYGRGHWWHWVWMIEPSWQTGDHIRLAVHNARVHR